MSSCVMWAPFLLNDIPGFFLSLLVSSGWHKIIEKLCVTLTHTHTHKPGNRCWGCVHGFNPIVEQSSGHDPVFCTGSAQLQCSWQQSVPATLSQLLLCWIVNVKIGFMSIKQRTILHLIYMKQELTRAITFIHKKPFGVIKQILYFSKSV